MIKNDGVELGTKKETISDVDINAILTEAKKYHEGDGVPVDFNRELELLRRAAFHGSTQAVYELGVKLSTGICGELDRNKAESYLKKIVASEPQGRDRMYVGKALRHLGMMSEEDGDLTNANNYYKKAMHSQTLSAEMMEDVHSKIRDCNKKIKIRSRKKIMADTPSEQPEPSDQMKTEKIAGDKIAKPSLSIPQPPPSPESYGGKRKSSALKYIIWVCIIMALLFGMFRCVIDEDRNETPDSGEESYMIYEDYPEDFVLPNSSSEYLDEFDVEGLDLEDTQWAINEIYARHGVIYHEEPYSSYFYDCEWYMPEYNVDEVDSSWFNEYEQYNIDLLAEHRSELQ